MSSRICRTQVRTTTFRARSSSASFRKDCIIWNSPVMKTRSRCALCRSLESSSIAVCALVSAPSTTDLARPTARSAIAADSVSALLGGLGC